MVFEHEGPLKGGYWSMFLVLCTVLSIESVKVDSNAEISVKEMSFSDCC